MSRERFCRIAGIECFHDCEPGTCLRQPMTHPSAHCGKCGTWLFDSEQQLAAAVEYDGEVIETPGVCPECGNTELERRGS